jgi:hypothetical protein
MMLAWSIICAAAIVALRWKATTDAQFRRPQWTSIAIALVSFVIWLYAVGGPVAAYGLKPARDFIGSLAILAWTFFIPLWY